jgi:putative inorganic carbon (HCO3(-)) transporter
MRDLSFAFAWMLLLPASLMSAYVGVLLWVWVALLSPNELLFGFMGSVPFNKIVVVTTVIGLFVSKEKKDLYLDATLGVLILFCVAATCSWVGSIVPSDDATDLYQKILKEIVLAFFITAVITTRGRLHLLILSIVIALGFIATKEGLISLLTAGGHLIIGTGSIGDNNSLATALLMIIPLIYYLIRYSVAKPVKIILASVLGLSVVTVIMTFSRGGFIGLVVLSLFLVKNSKNKIVSLVLVMFAGALIYTFAPEAWFSRLNTIETGNNDASFMGRVVAWKISWLIAMDHPLFGGGMHAVQRLLVWNTYKPFLYQLDFVTTPPADVVPHAAHSIYFEVLGDLGFVGLFLFVTMLGLGFWNCHRIYRMSRGNASLAWAADLARMMQISLIVYAVTAAALSLAYFELIYIMIALLSRCKRTVQLTLAAETAPSPGQQPLRRERYIPVPRI